MTGPAGGSPRHPLRAVVRVGAIVAAVLSLVVGVVLLLAAVGDDARDLTDRLLPVGLGVLLLAAAAGLGAQELARRRAATAGRRQRDEVRRQAAAVLQRVDDVRAKQSRHEYQHEAALGRIEEMLAAVRADVEGQTWAGRQSAGRVLDFAPARAGIPRVLFVTSNGAGLGHLTRCLAVAEHCRDVMSAAVVTLSTAHDVAARLGYGVDYVASPAVTGEDWSVWHRRFSRHLHGVLAANAVDVVVFDGTWVYRAVTEVCERFDVPLVWMCRGTWRSGADTTQVRRPLRHCDHVVVPDDVSGAELTIDTDASWVTRCAPITMVDDGQVLPAADARRKLGLTPDGRYVLVQVGGGNVADVSDLTGRVVELVRRHGQDLVPVVISSPVSRHDDLPPGAATVLSGVYPLAPYLRAFEFAVCRGGYNTVHENLAVALPAVYVPSEATTTDDQGARVDAVAGAGLGLAARTDGEIAAAVERLCDASTLATVRAALHGTAVANGAREAGLAVLAVAGRGRA